MDETKPMEYREDAMEKEKPKQILDEPKKPKKKKDKRKKYYPNEFAWVKTQSEKLAKLLAIVWGLEHNRFYTVDNNRS